MMLGCRWTLLFITLWIVTASRVAPAQFGDWKFDGFPNPSPAISTTGIPGGWYGGDSAYSIALDSNTLLWTFADVYIGAAPDRTTRNRSKACTGISIGNSIALSRRDPVTRVVTTTHYFRGSPTPDASGVFSDGPYPFFAPPNVTPRDRNKSNGDRLWPRKAVLLDGSLYIFAFLVNTEKDIYTYKQTVIIKVVNPFDPPPRWEFGFLEIGKLTGKQVPAYYGADAFYVESPDPKQNYLYVYGVYCRNHDQFFDKFQMLGLRIPLDKLKAAKFGTNLEPVTEVMARKYGTWRPLPVDPNDFYEIGNSSNFGYQSISTRFNKTLNAWQATFAYDKEIEAGKLGSKDPKTRSVWVVKGEGPFGPWEKPILAYTFPEASIASPTPGVKPTAPRQFPTDPRTIRNRPPGGIYEGKIFCYIAREVPELESSDDVLDLIYATDTTRPDVDRYWNLDMYTVKIVRGIPNPLMKSRPTSEPGR